MGLLGFLRPLLKTLGFERSADGPAEATGSPVDRFLQAPSFEPSEPQQIDLRPHVPQSISEGEFPQALADDLDDALGGVFAMGAEPVDSNAPIDLATAGGETSSPSQADERAVRELFAGIAANYSRPVKNLIYELRRGPVSKEWIEICQPVMGSVIDAARSVELGDTVECMLEFSEILSLAETTEGETFDDETRQMLLSTYDEMVELLPEAFGLSDSDERRESIIIHSLLRQIPGVGHVTLERLYGTGLTSLDALFLANAGDLSAVSGVSHDLCWRICDKVQEHRRQIHGDVEGGMKHDPRQALAGLIEELRAQQSEFQRISSEDRSTREFAVAKREALRNRQACALRVEVLLAEMGEINLIDELKKLAVERRVERLEQYLEAGTTDVLVPALAMQTPETRPETRGT